MLSCTFDLSSLIFCSRPSTRRSAARLRSTSEETAPPTATPGSPEDDLTRDLPQPTQPLKVEEVPANQQHQQQLLQQANGEGKPARQAVGQRIRVLNLNCPKSSDHTVAN